ncbi:Development/cell death domain [Macleaya cordata]|uniref:Development/cell death domain n=1 Tax=Macleaya cordata TaxID=56857 RepID=A0A200QKS6_MACCD|nr:Development/cell death domain [Macleaya cordata]
MSMIKNNSNRGAVWQCGSDLKRADLGSNDEQTWRMAASRLALDNQLMRRNISSSFSDMLVLNQNAEEIKDPFVPPMCKPITFYGQQCINNQVVGQAEKWYKTLPPAEMLPRNEVILKKSGYSKTLTMINMVYEHHILDQLHVDPTSKDGYCNTAYCNILFYGVHMEMIQGLPQKYKDSVRAITPGLPLFLYNYTAHQLHGVFQAVSFGGSNIDPTAWEDKKCRGESRFPAQVRIRVKKKCKPLEEDSFRPILFHYDGPKFRLQLSVPEALALLDLFTEDQM